MSEILAPADAGDILLALARTAITREFATVTHTAITHTAQWLQTPGASFVTLKKSGTMRGRAGTPAAQRPLAEDIAANAAAAAFRDLRFQPLTPDELQAIHIEVAVLSEPEVLDASSEAAAIARLRAGSDGVIFRYGHHRSIFLPEAWAEYTDPAEFMAHLKYRAGLPPDFWDADVQLQRYTATVWRESQD